MHYNIYLAEKIPAIEENKKESLEVLAEIERLKPDAANTRGDRVFAGGNSRVNKCCPLIKIRVQRNEIAAHKGELFLLQKCRM